MKRFSFLAFLLPLILVSLLPAQSVKTNSPAEKSSATQTAAAESMLPTAKETVLDLWKLMVKKYKQVPSSEQTNAAYDAAYQAEIEAILAGHAERVAVEDLAECQSRIDARKHAEAVAARDAIYEAAKTAKRNHEALLHHCGFEVRLGITEQCVYILLGYPDRTTEDALSGKLLDYSENLYVYINLEGIVRNVQKTY